MFNFGAALTLKDNFTVQMNKAIGTVGKFGKEVAGADVHNLRMAKSSTGLGTAIKGMVGMAAGYATFQGVTNLLKGCVTAADNAEMAGTRLNTMMKNVPGSSAKGIQSIKDTAGALTQVGVVSKGVSIAGASQLASFQLQTTSIKKLLPGLDNLLVATKGVNGTQQDAIQIGKVLGRAMEGQAGALTRYGIVLTAHQQKIIKTGTEQQRLAVITSALQHSVGGLNQSMANTDQGAIKKYQNQIAAIKAGIGAGLMPTIRQLMQTISSNMPKIVPLIQQLATGTVSALKIIATVGIPILVKLASALDWLSKHGEVTKTALIGIAAGFSALKAVMVVQQFQAGMNCMEGLTGIVPKLGSAFMELRTAPTILTGIKGAFTALFGCNPMVLAIVAGVALLAIGAYELIKHWSGVKAFFAGVFKSITSEFGKAKAFILKLINEATNWGKNLIGNIVKGIGSMAGSVGNAIKGVFSGVAGAVGLNLPGRAIGIPRVPFDNYPVLLHEGEQVLTKREANQNKSMGGGVTIAKLADTLVVREEADIDKIASKLVLKIQHAALNMA